MQVYNGGEQPATHNEQAAPDLDGEQRERAHGILRGLNALNIEDSIARAERREPDAAGRTWRIGAHVGKMCRQLIYWEDKSEDPDYRVHKTGREWFESEAGITRGQLRTATRIAVEEGLLTVEPGYRPDRRQTNYYRLNMWNLLRTVIACDLQNIGRLLEREGRKYRRDTLNRKRRALEAALKDLNLLETGDSENPHLEIHGGQIDQGRWSISQSTPVNLHPLQENTQENTPKDFPPGGAAAPQAGESKDKDQVPKTSKTSTLSADSENQQHKAARELVEKLNADLEAVGVLLDDDQRERYRINFKRLIDKGVDAGELEKARKRIVERGPDHLIRSPQEALQDVRGGMGDKAKGTPPAGIKYIQEYRIRRYAPGDSIGPSIAASRDRLAEVAKHWDFTSDKEPPMSIRLQISEYRQACDEMIVRLRQMTRRAVREAEGESEGAAMAKMGPFSDPPNPASAARMDSPALEDASGGSTAPQPAEGNERPALNWADGWDNDLIPVGVSEEIRKAAAVLQDTNQDAGRVFRGFLNGRLTQEQAVEAAVWAVYGTFEPAGGTGRIGTVVEDLYYLLAADKDRMRA